MLIRLLRQYLRPHKGAIALVVALQLAATIAALYLPSLNADIINGGVAKGDTGYIVRVGGIMLAVTIAQIACTIVAVYFAARTAMRLGRDVRGDLFARVGTFSDREVQKFGAPSLITRTTNDVTQIQTMVVMGGTMLLIAPIMCVGGVIMALQQDAELSWLIAALIPLLLIGVGPLVWRMLPQYRLMQKKLDAVNRVLREQITGVRVLRAFVREGYETERFDVANRELTGTALKVGKLMAFMFPIVMLLMNGSSVAVMYFGGHRVADGMEVGALTAFLSYLVQILMSVMMATFMMVMVPRAAVCAGRINEVLDTRTSVTPPESPMTPAARTGVVEFRDVSLTYPGAVDPVLKNVTVTARPGKTTAIIGATGSGKTTLLSLIPRLFDVTAGSVAVDGVDVREQQPDELWSRMSLVPQRAYLFSGTVATNLRYGKSEATDDELWAALEVAQAADFVRAMPLGLDSPISQGGTNVSGGQRQRLAIARAVVRGSAIYLFDDSFSALDLSTDAKLRTALGPVTRESTVIIVAQRVSTIQDADQIIVLDDGAVVGVGTHDELLASCDTYAAIVDSQLSAEAAA